MESFKHVLLEKDCRFGWGGSLTPLDTYRVKIEKSNNDSDTIDVDSELHNYFAEESFRPTLYFW